MGLDGLCKEIEASASAKASRMVSQAHEEAQATLKQAQEAARQAVQSARNEGEAFAGAERAERINAARLEAQKALSEARETAVRAGTQAVWTAFAAQRKRPGYAKKLLKWARQASDELDLPGSLLHAHPDDRTLLSNAGFKVATEGLECSGGVLARSKDGRIQADYTLESLFERKREEIYREVYDRLFPGDEESPALGSSSGAGMGGEGGKAAKAARKPKASAARPSARRKAPRPRGRRG